MRTPARSSLGKFVVATTMRASDPGATIADMGEAGTRIVIDLKRGGAEPTGELRVPGEPTRPFAGWIELVAALEGAFGSAVDEPSPREA